LKLFSVAGLRRDRDRARALHHAGKSAR
jgi:hypothetical protein